jgi:hypothetical protein
MTANTCCVYTSTVTESEGALVAVVVPPPPTTVMDTVLTWIGFDQEATRDCLRGEGFDTFADLATLNDKDIRDLAESYEAKLLPTEERFLDCAAFATISLD